MNHDNIKDMIDFFSTMNNGPDAECGFDMNVEPQYKDKSGHPCGSAMCIGGWVQTLHYPLDIGSSLEVSVAKHFDIPLRDAYYICWPSGIDGAYTESEPSDAVVLLNILLDTGEVDWKTVMEVKYQ